MAKKTRKLTKLEQVCIVAVAAVVLLYVYKTRIYDKTLSSLKTTTSSVASLEAEVLKLKASPPAKEVLGKVRTLQAELRKANDELQAVRVSLASSDEVTRVIADIMVSAESHNLKPRTYGPADPPRKGKHAADKLDDPLKRSYYRVVVLGSFNDATDFIASLSQTSKVVTIEDISISIENERGDLVMSLLLCI